MDYNLARKGYAQRKYNVLGVEGYEPHFFRTAQELINTRGSAIRALYGMKLQGVWLMWDRKDDSWWQDGPVILEFDDLQCELCANKLSEYSVTFDSIDREQSLDWFGIEEIQLTWKVNPLPEIIPFVGQAVSGIFVTEYYFETTVVANRNYPERIGQVDATWLLHGILFKLNDQWLHAYNGLDQNSLEYDEPSRDTFRKTQI